MSKTPTVRELREHPAVRHYMLFCLVSLLLQVVCMSERGLGWIGVVPAVLGALALLMHWSLGPPVVLIALAGLLGMAPGRYRYAEQQQVPTLLDLLLCIATLGYVVGHYRLLSLLRHIFPLDPRRVGPLADPARRRSVDLVSTIEMTLLGVGVPAWTVLGLLVWTWMAVKSEDTPLGISTDAWRVLRLIWAFLLVFTMSAVLVAHRRMKRMSPEESLLYLQDQVWLLTRRDQGNLNRWLTWARLRARRKKGQS
jgi:hypothetical protein